ncbi:hypothetical protein CUMW_242930 [Citrus unshiu]|uniref:Uncharacterized protein n=1 Tax=Citrus unshiu TaxID=55188 RepID=A0A2H5QM23_CITUN|nr:hypothetical protein CUMW_242930 [Citrus unshiu]
MFVRAEKNVNELNLFGELMKKESKTLLERAALAEKDMIRGETELKSVLTVQAYNYHVTAFQWHPEVFAGIIKSFFFFQRSEKYLLV